MTRFLKFFLFSFIFFAFTINTYGAEVKSDIEIPVMAPLTDVTICIEVGAVLMSVQVCIEVTIPDQWKSSTDAFQNGISGDIQGEQLLVLEGFDSSLEGVPITLEQDEPLLPEGATLPERYYIAQRGTYYIRNGHVYIPIETVE